MKNFCCLAPLSFITFIAILLTLSGCGNPRLQQAQALHDEGRLTEAIDLYRSILPQLSSDSDRQAINIKLTEALQKVATDAINRAKSKLTNKEAMEEYSQAIAILESHKQYDNSRKDIQALLIKFQKRRDDLARRRELIIAAENFAAQKKWGDAIKNINIALRIKEDHATGDTLQKLIKNRDSQYTQTVNAACKSGDWQKAQEIINDLIRETPTPHNTILKPLIVLAKETKVKVVTDAVEKHRKHNRYISAYQIISDIGESDFKELLQSIRDEGSVYYISVSKKEYADNKPFHAYIAAVKAKTLDPVQDDIFKFHRDREDEVDASIRVQIGIPAFSSPQNKPEAGEEFSDALISYLNKTLPYGISIMERSKIDMLLKERRLNNMKKAAEILGTDLFATGNVSTLNVDSLGREQTKRTITERVKMGKVNVPNPEYSDFLTRYGSDKSFWPRIPRRTIEQDVYEIVKYERGEGKIQGAMTVSVRMFTMGGAIIRSETFRTDDMVQDTFQDGVPAANIKDDPLELPTVLAMEQKLSQRVVEKVAPWMLESFQVRQGRYYLEGENHIQRREYDKAVVALAKGYLYSIKDNVDPEDEWFKKIYQTVFFDLTEPKD